MNQTLDFDLIAARLTVAVPSPTTRRILFQRPDGLGLSEALVALQGQRFTVEDHRLLMNELQEFAQVSTISLDYRRVIAEALFPGFLIQNRRFFRDALTEAARTPRRLPTRFSKILTIQCLAFKASAPTDTFI